VRSPEPKDDASGETKAAPQADASADSSTTTTPVEPEKLPTFEDDPKAYCAYQESHRQTRGTMTGKPDDADLTADLSESSPVNDEPGWLVLTLHLQQAPVFTTSESGRTRQDVSSSSRFRTPVVDGESPFAVGTYEVEVYYEGTAMQCWDGGGFGGGSPPTEWTPVTLTITKHEDGVIEGTYGDVTFSAPIADAASPRCCL
jgi:hypothetical protein